MVNLISTYQLRFFRSLLHTNTGKQGAWRTKLTEVFLMESLVKSDNPLDSKRINQLGSLRPN